MIIIAAVMLAAIAPMRAQDFIRLNDTTWVRSFEQKGGTTTEYAYPVDLTRLTVENNNSMRSAGSCFLGGLCCVAISGGSGAIYAVGGGKAFLAGAIVFATASTVLDIVGCFKLKRSRVYITEEGVAIKIGKTDKPKYDNKKLRQ